MTHYSAHLAKEFYAEVVGADGAARHLHVDRTVFFAGHVLGHSSSRVTARVDPVAGRLHATITLRDGEMYRIEPPSEREHPELDYELEDEGLNHVVYRRSDLADDRRSSGTCGTGDHSHAPEAAVSRTRRATPQGDSCVVWLRLDQFFYAGRAGSSEIGATEIAVDMFFASNANFRDAQMIGGGGIVTDVNGNSRFGPALGRITIYTSAGAASGGEGNPFSATSVSGVYLNQLETQDGRNYCLGHALTHQVFDGSVLGLAYVGTICGGSASGSKNTGITTTAGSGGTSPYLTSVLVLTHELGHNFNMPHDNGGCSSGVDRGTGGNFIMQAQAVDGSQPNNDQFSECSRTFAGTKLTGGGGSCFAEVGEGGAVCGNGIAEVGELCDCGYNLASPTAAQTAACQAVDPCCTATDCQLKPSATCSAKALFGSVCCDEATCQPIAAAIDTIDGSGSTPAEQSAAKCRDETDCSKAAYCLSPSFTWSNGTTVTQAYPFNVGKCLGISTFDGGSQVYAKGDGGLCNDGTQTCLDGYCTGSLCAAYGYTDGSGSFTPTQCELPLGQGDCEVACKFSRGSEACTSSYDVTNDLGPLGSEGLEVNGSFRAAGSTCRTFTGYCSSSGVCQTVSSDDPFDVFANINYSQWVWDNWWVVLAIESGFIALAFMLRWSKQQQDTKAYVNSQVGKMRGQMHTLMRKQLFKRGSRRDLPVQVPPRALFLLRDAHLTPAVQGESKSIAKKKKRASMEREFQQLASAHPHMPPRSAHRPVTHDAQVPRRRGEAGAAQVGARWRPERGHAPPQGALPLCGTPCAGHSDQAFAARGGRCGAAADARVQDAHDAGLQGPHIRGEARQACCQPAARRAAGRQATRPGLPPGQPPGRRENVRQGAAARVSGRRGRPVLGPRAAARPHADGSSWGRPPVPGSAAAARPHQNCGPDRRKQGVPRAARPGAAAPGQLCVARGEAKVEPLTAPQARGRTRRWSGAGTRDPTPRSGRAANLLRRREWRADGRTGARTSIAGRTAVPESDAL